MYCVDYRYLRPKKAAALKRQHAASYEVLETPRIWQGKDATVLPVRKIDQYNWIGCGGVLDQAGKCVDISAVECCVQPGKAFGSPEYRDEKIVYCGYLIKHWGHFLVEGVARLWYFLENDPTIDKYVFVLDHEEEREIKGNYREFLELLGIWDKLAFVNRPTTFREVIVPDLAFRRRGGYSPKYLAIFDAVASHVPAPKEQMPGKIYMSRSLLPKHKDVEFGFEAIDNFHQKNGYEVLYPEQIPLSRMIQYIRSAHVVATVSGSLPHNMLFGKQGQKLIIWERCAIINDWQPPVDRIKELQVTYIDANIPLYTVPMTGPFIMGYNNIVERYAQDSQMVPPDMCYRSQKYFRSCFVGYMKAYQDLYRYQWFVEEYLLPEMDYHIEAYQYGADFYRDYLNGSRPFRWHHYFEPHYWKQLIKRLLKVQR